MAETHTIDLRGADLSGADLRSANYSKYTAFPSDFDAKAAGALEL